MNVGVFSAVVHVSDGELGDLFFASHAPKQRGPHAYTPKHAW